MYGIIIQRNPEDILGANDDNIRIEKIDSNMFQVEYIDKENKENTHSYSFMANGVNLIKYIQNMLNTLVVDYQPFEAIQINLPIFPSFVVLIKDLDEHKIMCIVDAFQKYVDFDPRKT